jgi:hypothetical protein
MGSIVNACYPEINNREIIIEKLKQQYNSENFELMKKKIVKIVMPSYFKRLKNFNQIPENEIDINNEKNNINQEEEKKKK